MDSTPLGVVAVYYTRALGDTNVGLPFDAGLPRAQYGSFDYSIGTNYEVFDYAQRPFPSVPFLRAHHNNVTDGRCVSLSGTSRLLNAFGTGGWEASVW